MLYTYTLCTKMRTSAVSVSNSRRLFVMPCIQFGSGTRRYDASKWPHMSDYVALYHPLDVFKYKNVSNFDVRH